MQNQGLLVANEIHPRRVWELAENIERWGASNVVVTNETPERLADHFGSYFDKVLLDAPCSGEGMFRKSENARLEWKPSLVQSCAHRQNQILDQAARLVCPGGALLYATCTFSPEENEGVIAGFLPRQPNFQLENITQNPGFTSGRPDWLRFPPDDRNQDTLKKTVRLWPHKALWEGLFVALMRRTDRGQAARLRGWDFQRIPVEAQRAWEEYKYKQLFPDEFYEPLIHVPLSQTANRGLSGQSTKTLSNISRPVWYRFHPECASLAQVGRLAQGYQLR